MALITLSGVRKSFGAFQVLDEVTFTIGPSEKVALVGPNGSGKTTILRLIAGLDEPDTGLVQVLPGTSIGFMPQDSELTGGGTLVEEVSNASTEIKRLERELRRLESAMSAAQDRELDALLAEYGEVQHEFDRLGGYSFDAEVKSALSGLGLGPEHWEKRVEILSGGQKTRAALAKLLLQKPDVLLLDEPTNHLDIEACEWLEAFLQGFPGAALVVSHDRYLLDKVVTKVVDLHEGCTKSYPGNYTSYAKQKEESVRQQLENFERQQEEIGKLEDFIQRYHAGQRHREARGRQKKLDKMARLRKPKMQTDKMKVRFDAAMSSGHIVIDLRDLGKSWDETPLFSGLNLLVEKGDRIGLVGPNGSGKTTLLRMIVGDEEPSAGTLSLGYGVEIGYFAQEISGLDPVNTVLEEILDSADLTPHEARSLLARFLFTGDDVFKSVARLSGGEQNRLILAKLMLQRPNLLILDEPTNHLDIDARQSLDRALKDFEGTIILTTHDRYLLNSVANKIVELANGIGRVFEGNYDFFAERVRTIRARPAKKKPKPAAQKTHPTGPTRPAGPTASDIEQEIEAAESRLMELADLLGRPETYTDGSRAAAAQAEYHELSTRLEELYKDWEALSR
jgi:ATP-binding cassette subfamily F protein 3